MKIKLCILMTVLLWMLTGCQCKHEWVEADCVTAKTCSVCREVNGEPLGHDWREASCEEPKLCTRCQGVEGEALGHSWQEPDCTQPKRCERCEITEGESLGHSYDHWMVVQGKMERTCWKCKDQQIEEIDRKVLAEELAIGKWVGEYATNGEGYVEMPEEEYIYLSEDYQFLMCFTGQTYMGTWEFDKYVEEDLNTPIYEYELDAGDFCIYIFTRDMAGGDNMYLLAEKVLFSYRREE